MRLLIACIATSALLISPAMAGGGGGGSFSGGYGGFGAGSCGGGFSAGYGGGSCVAPAASFAAPAYGAMVAAPSYSVQSFAAPVYSAPLVQQSVIAAPAYGYSASFAAPMYGGGFAGRRFGGFRGRRARSRRRPDPWCPSGIPRGAEEPAQRILTISSERRRWYSASYFPRRPSCRSTSLRR
jgi:hypothetical protein